MYMGIVGSIALIECMASLYHCSKEGSCCGSLSSSIPSRLGSGGSNSSVSGRDEKGVVFVFVGVGVGVWSDAVEGFCWSGMKERRRPILETGWTVGGGGGGGG